ncbi:MAG: hypothetical protein IKP73_09570 [Bacteroidales bacterium]|nr:hypothetical protein [Bacteroidales bacterium]
MAEIKALVINSKETLQGAPGKWHDMSSQMHSLTSKIITPKLSEGTNASAMVSGVPTVFARENLFVYSIENAGTLRAQKDKEDDSGLCGYYLNLVDEWRGFIAFIALNSGKLDAKRITLAYSDKKSIKDTSNIYEPKGAFGNMLLENANLWKDPTDNDRTKKPFIHVIKYGDKVVGGTSPRSLLFTAVSYSIDEESPCVDKATHRFTDPLQNNPNKEQITALYAYVKQLLQKLDRFDKTFNAALNNAIDYKNVKSELGKWLVEIENKIENDADKAKASAWPVNLFKRKPFDVFDYSDSLYGKNGVIFSDPMGGEAFEFDANDLLLPKDSVVARLHVSPEIEKQQKNYSEFMPIFALKAKKMGTNEYAFFALPLSETALKIFSTQNALQTFLGENPINNEVKSSLKAQFNTDTNKLEVTLDVITTDTDKQKTINMEYAVGSPMVKNDIMIWPNFISAQWTKYYMYSELPHNVASSKCQFMAVPFIGEAELDLEGIADPDGNIKYLGDKHITALSDSRTSDQMYKYEIYESDKPFKGVKMMTNGHLGGFFIVKYDSMGGNYIPTYYATKPLKDVTIGVDFGSTNTAVAYFDKNTDNEARGLELKDQVVSLLQSEAAQGKCPTVEKHLLFFQSESTYSNDIKSVLAIQSDQHLPKDKMSEPTERLHYIEEPVKGGMPCFCREIPIKRVEGDKLIAEMPSNSTNITLIQNMKWVDDAEEKARKTAYLGSLLLHVYANLFELNKVPTKLNWSYPSAMGDVLVRQYGQIWKSLGVDGHSPVKDKTLAIAGTQSGADSITETKWDDSNDTSDAWQSNESDWESSDSDWGSNSTTDGWGSDNSDWNDKPAQKTSKKSSVKIDTGEDNVFNFTKIDSNAALTEACAVANFLSHNNNLSSGKNILTLSFDIGGSTTDISAICQYGDQKYMIKQNSIRFAAQRLSYATKEMFEPFGNVLKNVCHKNGIQLLGLNSGPDLYNKDTAPYFFEQIVDRLDDSQLHDFYNEVAANCPGLFTVNLYVTGLVLFYAGQIVTKLIKEIRRSSVFPDFNDWKPAVQIVFTGKGSRVVEWLYSIDENSSRKYNFKMFCAGMGGVNVAKTMLSKEPSIKVEKRSAREVKFEVAKGLAMADHSNNLKLNMQCLEIIGEEGFSFTNPETGEVKALAFDDSITADMLRYTSVYFDAPSDIKPMETRFFEFIRIFYDYASHLFGFSMSQSEILSGIANMNYNTYIKNLPEYRKASENGGKAFDFVAPIIILEGMKFYDEYLLKGVRK